MAEEQLRVVVQEDEAHVVDGADLVHPLIAEVAVQKLQERTHPLRRSWLDGEERRQLRDFPLTGADPASAFQFGVNSVAGPLDSTIADHIFQRGLRYL